MKIELRQLGKHFHYRWVFRDINYTFESGKRYAILGPNGAGKSTLLKLIAGHLSPSEGEIIYQGEKLTIERKHWYQQIVVAAPYLELIREFSFREMARFHFRLKPLRAQSLDNVYESFPFPDQLDKPLKYYSSGMLQRVKLVLAILSNVPILLLDEPMTNLDEEGRQWYRQLLEQYFGDRLLILCSNWEEEYRHCEETLLLDT